MLWCTVGKTSNFEKFEIWIHRFWRNQHTRSLSIFTEHTLVQSELDNTDYHCIEHLNFLFFPQGFVQNDYGSWVPRPLVGVTNRWIITYRLGKGKGVRRETGNGNENINELWEKRRLGSSQYRSFLYKLKIKFSFLTASLFTLKFVVYRVWFEIIWRQPWQRHTLQSRQRH